MNQLAALIGVENAKRLAELAGGTRLIIPRDLPHGEAPPALARVVGSDLAVLLVLHFGDSAIYVPVLERSTSVDGQAVAALAAQGLNANAIARSLKCSVRTVYGKLPKPKPAKNPRKPPKPLKRKD